MYLALKTDNNPIRYMTYPRFRALYKQTKMNEKYMNIFLLFFTYFVLNPAVPYWISVFTVFGCISRANAYTVLYGPAMLAIITCLSSYLAIYTFKCQIQGNEEMAYWFQPITVRSRAGVALNMNGFIRKKRGSGNRKLFN